jgi:hypothetical protein
MGLGHDEVFRHALTLHEVQGKVVQRPCIPPVGRLPKERDRPHRIRGQPLPRGAHQRQGDLGIRVSLCRRLFIPRSGGRQIDLDPETVRVNDAEAQFAGRVALVGGGGIPAPRLGVIDLAAIPASPHQGEVCLRRRIALLGSLTAPAQGFGMVRGNRNPVWKHQIAIAVGDDFVDRGGAVVPLGDPAIGPAAMQIGQAQLVLRLGMPPLRRLPEPHDGVAQTADDALAPRVQQTQLKLAFGVAARRRFREVAPRLRIVSPSPGGKPGSHKAAGAAGAVGGGRGRHSRGGIRVHASPRLCRATRPP